MGEKERKEKNLEKTAPTRSRRMADDKEKESRKAA